MPSGHTSDRATAPGEDTVMILNFWTDISGQTLQTQIRRLLEEESDQGLHFLPFRLHHLDAILCCKSILFIL